MRKKIAVMLFIGMFMLSTIAWVHADVSVVGNIDENVNVVINLTNLNQTIYTAAKSSQIFNGSAIAQIIFLNLQKQGRNSLTTGFQLNTYDDANRAIKVQFFLSGTDVITSAINRTTVKRNFQVQTDWRRFRANLTNSISIDFASFGQTVDKWQRANFTDSTGIVHPSFYYETGGSEQLGAMSFRFVLPSDATNARAIGDTITYDVPLGFEDVLLSSPFPILAAVIIAVIMALIYRRLR